MMPHVELVSLFTGLVLVGYAFVYLLLVAFFDVTTPTFVLPRGRVVRIRFRAWLPRCLGHDATTVFGIIWVADRAAPADLIAHEYRHTLQERGLGYVGYLPLYLWRMWRAGSYFGDSMEADARAYAAAHVREFIDLEAAP